MSDPSDSIPSYQTRARIRRAPAIVAAAFLAVAATVGGLKLTASPRSAPGQAVWVTIDAESKVWSELKSESRFLKTRFGPFAPAGYAAQSVRLDGGGRALLIGDALRNRQPLLRVFDKRWRLRWRKNYPTDPDNEGHDDLTLCAAPDGGVLIVWSSPPWTTKPEGTRARLFDAEGRLAGEFEIAERVADGRISTLYWPGRGWVVAAAQRRADPNRPAAVEAFVQLNGIDGSLRWRRSIGPNVGQFPQGYGISMILDSADSLTALWCELAEPSGGLPGPNLHVTQRFSPDGEPRWPRPVTVGQAPTYFAHFPGRIETIELRRQRDGVVVARLRDGRTPKGPSDVPVSSAEYLATIDADGRVRVDPIPKVAPAADRRPIG
jgi:hypothetical protein